jgi:hypothetical protein
MLHEILFEMFVSCSTPISVSANRVKGIKIAQFVDE